MALSHISQLPSLKQLNVSHCSKLSIGFAFFASSQLATTLLVLNVGFCEIQDPVMSFIGSLKGLRELDLSCNRFSDAGVQALKGLNLSILDLSMNNLTDDTIRMLHEMTTLEALNINFCTQISSNALTILSRKLPNLNKIDMNGCDRVITDVQKRPLVLLAEDNKLQARMITMVFNRYNFDVEVAKDGADALALFKDNRGFDLVLMDMNMPEMNGIECLTAIRAFEMENNLERTPLIVQTAGVQDKERRAAFDAGCDEFIRKPLDRSCIQLAKELMAKSEKRNG
jgi:CheY-like chemotaxis protein